MYMINKLIINYKLRKLVNNLNRYNAYKVEDMGKFVLKLKKIRTRKQLDTNYYMNKLIYLIDDYIENNVHSLNMNVSLFLGAYLRDFVMELDKYKSEKEAIEVINIIYKYA